MITWVTVWVLTTISHVNQTNEVREQYTYATEAICKRQGERLDKSYSCNFQQVPVYVPKWGK